MDISNQVQALARAIMQTKEYKEFKSIRSNASKNKEVVDKVNELKELQLKLYQANVTNKTIDPRKKNEMVSKVNKLNSESNVTNYLKSESEFYSILYKSLNSVTEAVESTLR